MHGDNHDGASHLRKAIEFYDHLLTSRHLETTAAALSQAVDAQSVPGLERELCSLLRPRLLTSPQRQQIQQATLGVFRALKHLQSLMIKDPRVLSLLRLDERHLSLVRNSLATSVGVLGRFDGFVDTGGTVQFMEYNPFPGGAVYVDTVAAAFLGTPIMKDFAERYPVESFFNATQMLPAVGMAFARHGGSGVPCIAIVSSAGHDPAVQAPSQGSMLSLQFERSFEVQRIIALLGQHGVPHVLAAPHQLEYAPGTGLHVDGKKIDAVFVGSWDDFLGQPASHPLFVAARDRAVWMLNSVIDTVMLGNKGALALISDPASNGFLSHEERAAVDRHLPWTRILREGKTQHAGRNVDLVELVSTQKDDFVLKPADGWGGADIVMGAECGASAWGDALARAMQGRYVVQQRIVSEAEPYPVIENGSLSLVEHHVDIHPYLWADSVPYGMGSRASRSAVTNFKLGASVLPAFVLKQ